MSVVNANGVDLHSLVLGDSGPLVFMLHGLVAGSIATWYFHFAPELSRKYRVVLYDLRGHGKSEKATQGYDLATMAADLRDLIDHYTKLFPDADNQIHLVGHSYGALVTLYYTAHYKKLGAIAPNSLFLVDAPLPADQFVAPGMMSINDEASVSELAGKIMQDLGLDGGRRRRNFESNLRFLYLDSSMKADLSSSGDIGNEHLAAISIPVSLCYGQSSDCVAVADRLDVVLSRSIKHVLPCGHYITQEAPARLLELINQHLEDYADGQR